MNEYFLDASYAIALANPKDVNYESALKWAAEIAREGAKVVTTRAVLFEIGNYLSKRRIRSAAVQVIQSLEDDDNVEIVEITKSLFDQAFELFSKRSDKDWGLTDCLSFVVMEQRSITEALTADGHYDQAGFHALLRTA